VSRCRLKNQEYHQRFDDSCTIKSSIDVKITRNHKRYQSIGKNVHSSTRAIKPPRTDELSISTNKLRKNDLSFVTKMKFLLFIRNNSKVQSKESGLVGNSGNLFKYTKVFRLARNSTGTTSTKLFRSFLLEVFRPQQWNQWWPGPD